MGKEFWTIDGKILSNTSNKKVYLCKRCPCFGGDICIRTQGFQHPGCIDFTLSNGRGYIAASCDRDLYSKCCDLTSYSEGTFNVKVRWSRGHYPYPEIDKMSVWVFRKEVASNRHFPCACNGDDYLDVATVHIDSEGNIEVIPLSSASDEFE